MRVYTKESLIDALREIKRRGWIKNARPGNDGGIGNTLEDLLGITENNLPIPNAAEWELKSQREGTNSLTTLFHSEPSPRALQLVPSLLLPKYGWRHQNAGILYPETELSFRQTISGKARSDRGFKVVVDRSARKVLISFDAKSVSARHAEWLDSVNRRVGLGEISPQPYWGFDDLFHIAGTKLLNTFYVTAKRKKIDGEEYYFYDKVTILTGFSLEKFLQVLEDGNAFVDFDARTGHNHGTKFRIRQSARPRLYDEIVEVE
jgi:hypothetical protein